MSIAKEHRWLLLAVCAAQFFMPFMVAGVNAVLPPLGESLGASARELSLLGAVYTLGLVVFQLAGGTLGDIYGRRRIFLFGLSLFSVLALVLGFIPYIDLFIGLRLFQGMGAAMLSSASLALLASAAPKEMRASYLGLSNVAVYAGIACGPPVGGLVAGWLGWRWLFWGTGLAALAAMCIMVFRVPLEWRTAGEEPFDVPGCLLYGGAMAALTFGASCIADDHLLGGGLFLLCLVLLACFVWRELRSPFPMVDVRLLRSNRVLSLSLVAAFVNYCSFFGMVFFFSLYLQVGRGFSVQEAGLLLALQAAVQSLSSPLAARLCDRYDQGLISTAGTVFCGLGLLSAAFLDMDSSLWVIVGAQCLIGAGVSLFALPNTTIILEAAGPQRVGQASGLVGTVRTAGMLGNLTIITLTLSLFLGHEPVGRDNIGAFLHCMRVDMVLFGVLSLLAVGCTLARNRSGTKAPEPEERCHEDNRHQRQPAQKGQYGHGAGSFSGRGPQRRGGHGTGPPLRPAGFRLPQLFRLQAPGRGLVRTLRPEGRSCARAGRPGAGRRPGPGQPCLFRQRDGRHAFVPGTPVLPLCGL